MTVPAGEAGAAHHGHHGAVNDALAQAVHGLFLGQLIAALQELEVLHLQLLVGAGGGLHDGLAAALDLVGQVGGDVDGLEVLALADEGLLLEDAHHAGELAVFDDRHLDGGDVAAVLVGDGAQRALEVGVLLVHFIDDDHAGGVGLVAHGPGLLRAHVQAGDRAHGDQRALAHVHRAHLLAGEIKVAGNIHQIDLPVLPLQRRHGGGDGDLTLDLFRIVVHGGLAVLHAPLAVDRAGGEQKRLGQRGLADAAVTHDGQVADILGLIIFHMDSPCINVLLRAQAPSECTQYALNAIVYIFYQNFIDLKSPFKQDFYKLCGFSKVFYRDTRHIVGFAFI